MSTSSAQANAPASEPSTVPGKTAGWLDDRVGASKGIKALARKIFPDHWSFMLGEVALYSFIILLLSGTFLTLFFVPSAEPVTYNGGYLPLKGQTVSQAYASTVHLSFDVRGGLLMRQIHHWSALIFVAAIMAHMARVFFTGAFRKPRELNWIIGTVLATLAAVEGFAGYSLPDDLLSGTGLRIASSIILATPVVGSYLSFFIFGGEFPGEAFIPRLYTVHVLILPGIFLALIAAHLVLLVVQKHTQFPGSGRKNTNVVGYPAYPVYMAKAGGFFFIVFGVISLISALFTINPIWKYGPYDPSPVTAGSQPDFYMGWLDGAVRLTPGFTEVTFWGHTLSLNIIIPAMIVPGIMMTALALYPWIEQWASGDKREHHLLDRPRNAPTRTALGAAFISLYLVFLAAGGNDIIALKFKLSINDITNVLRVCVIAVPVIVFLITRRICLGLQEKDRDLVLHGRETGKMYRTESGEYFETHEELTEHQRWPLVSFDSPEPTAINTAADPRNPESPNRRSRQLQAKVSQFFYGHRVAPVTPTELEQAHAAHHHDAEDDAAAHTADSLAATPTPGNDHHG